MSRFNCGLIRKDAHVVHLSLSLTAKSDASFWDQSTHHGCLAYQAFLGSHRVDLQHQCLHDQVCLGLAEGAQILDAAVAEAAAAAASVLA